MKETKLKVLATGTGRCASVYAARFLTSIGIPCGHECIFDYRGFDYALAKLSGAIPITTSDCSRQRIKDGSYFPEPKWINEDDIVAESSYLAAPFLKADCFKDTKIIHLVRHPVKVINSFCNYLSYFQTRHPAFWDVAKRYETFIFSHVSDLFSDMSQYERCALYYIRWNEMIENNLKGRDYLRHKAEDSNDELFDFLGVPKQKVFFDDREINTYRNSAPPFTLDKLPPGKTLDLLKEMGIKYGYKMDSKYLLI